MEGSFSAVSSPNSQLKPDLKALAKHFFLQIPDFICSNICSIRNCQHFANIQKFWLEQIEFAVLIEKRFFRVNNAYSISKTAFSTRTLHFHDRKKSGRLISHHPMRLSGKTFVLGYQEILSVYPLLSGNLLISGKWLS